MSPSRTGHGRRRWTRAALAVSAGALLALTALTPGALAKQGPPGAPDPTDTTTSSGCKYYTWSSPPKLVIHLKEFETGGGDALNELLMVGNIQKAVDQFNEVGGTSAKVTKVETSYVPMSYDDWSADGEIHVGFTDPTSFAALAADHDLPATTAGFTGRTAYGCGLTEAHMLFPDMTSRTWTFSTPLIGAWHDDYDARYYDAGPKTPGGDYNWFRPLFLHELLHAFGMDHTETQYSFMNQPGNGGFPWANRPEADTVRPLPFDAFMLRARYPAAGSRYDVAVLNTWYKPAANADSDAADQMKLCKPSLGDSWAADTSTGTCGVNGATTVCAGDTLRTRYALANYSTDDMTVGAHLYFSRDETFSSTDAASTTGHDFDVQKAKSTLQEHTWTVPGLSPGATYHPILRVVAEHNGDNGAEAQSVRADWIPLRGTLTACTALSSSKAP